MARKSTKELLQVPFTLSTGRVTNWNTYDSTLTHAVVFLCTDSQGTVGHYLIDAFHSEEEAQAALDGKRLPRTIASYDGYSPYIAQAAK